MACSRNQRRIIVRDGGDEDNFNGGAEEASDFRLKKGGPMTQSELEEKIATLTVEHQFLMTRISVLERIGWRLRMALVILGVILLAGAVNHYLSRQVFSGRWWAVHDKQERITAWFDDQGLQLKDSHGAVRAKFGLVGSEESPMLQFFDRKNQVRAQLFLYVDGSGHLMLWDKDGKNYQYPPGAADQP